MRSLLQAPVCGVYAWTHVPSGKKYIGSSVHCWRRKGNHVNAIKKGETGSFHRVAAMLGLDNFIFEILEVCPEDKRLALEGVYINKMNSVQPNGFNLQKDPTKGWNYFWSDGMRQAKSFQTKAQMLAPNARIANSTQAKLRTSTPEGRKVQSLSAKTYWSSPEGRAHLCAKAKARWSSPQEQTAQSERRKAYYTTNPNAAKEQSKRAAQYHVMAKLNKTGRYSKNGRATLSANLKLSWIKRRIAEKDKPPRHCSDATKAKMRTSNRGISVETRAKMAATRLTKKEFKTAEQSGKKTTAKAFTPSEFFSWAQAKFKP